MLNKIADKLSKRLLIHNVITEDVIDIYTYGFELIISSLLSTISILLIGILLNKFFQTLAFLLVFILLRSFSGGYHAKTYTKCFIVTLSVYAITLVLSCVITIRLELYILLAVVGVLLLIVFAPIENPNKILNLSKKRKYKTLSILIFVLLISVGVLSMEIMTQVSSSIFFALVSDLLLLFIKNRKERRNHNESV